MTGIETIVAIILELSRTVNQSRRRQKRLLNPFGVQGVRTGYTIIVIDSFPFVAKAGNGRLSITMIV